MYSGEKFSGRPVKNIKRFDSHIPVLSTSDPLLKS